MKYYDVIHEMLKGAFQTSDPFCFSFVENLQHAGQCAKPTAE
jgi:hypothetical protein